MVPRKERVKMRLVLGTLSPDGLEVFRDVQAKVEKEEIEIRNKLREGESPQVSLFSTPDIVAMQQDSMGVGCKANRHTVAERIVNRLKKNGSVAFQPLALDVLENVAIRLTQIKELVKDLKVAGQRHASPRDLHE